ncbi:S-layer homology domain-containing protein [Tindallia californiensis]|uniref:S-layer homology domain-containing protein n=1 Tax=Tindallia californiensis TaxID=159292 RepID=A0A1H3N9N7_9FIRM|nr:S-layer homology domain-containing protein [Tindallia californiensis]SDY85474.1 S-layer homology domain-containing protein [Tindallia californiensis]
MVKVKWIAISVIIFLSTNITVVAMFDDTQDHWGEEYIFWATFDYSIFTGYPDGTFRPDNQITRAEFISILNKLLLLANEPYPQITSASIRYIDFDSEHWAYSHVLSFYQRAKGASHNEIDLKQVFSGPRLKPNKEITRYEAALISASITTPSLNKEMQTPTKLWDIDLQNPKNKQIQNLVTRDIITGFPDGSFRPEKPITRAEAASLAKKIFEDLSYVKEDYLVPLPMIENQRPNYPIFTMVAEIYDLNNTKGHRRFVDAVTSLEYIDIIGFIPYEERNLYDTDPIKTLWELVDSGYSNKIGTHYYLIRKDESLTLQQKKKLTNEAIQQYLSLSERYIDGIIDFMEISKTYADTGLFEMAAQKLQESTLQKKENLRMADLLSEHYIDKNNLEKAFNIYWSLLEETNDFDILIKTVQNIAYISNKSNNINESIKILEKTNDALQLKTLTENEKEELVYLIDAIHKQLLLQ